MASIALSVALRPLAASSPTLLTVLVSDMMQPTMPFASFLSTEYAGSLEGLPTAAVVAVSSFCWATTRSLVPLSSSSWAPLSSGPTATAARLAVAASCCVDCRALLAASASTSCEPLAEATRPFVVSTRSFACALSSSLCPLNVSAGFSLVRDPADANMAVVLRSPTSPSRACTAFSQARMPLAPCCRAPNSLATSADTCWLHADTCLRASKSSGLACSCLHTPTSPTVLDPSCRVAPSSSARFSSLSDVAAANLQSAATWLKFDTMSLRASTNCSLLAPSSAGRVAAIFLAPACMFALYSP
eukprot:comp24336_c0_seq1/m.46128 comp24336_c0_seq1/g.46128  ORF comp24336_c0_seq1/g.46128 comp24336_c0_seq1/m.46128 type:complete len:302 (+) comp24336_c0_seq1:1574-2479(+)